MERSEEVVKEEKDKVVVAEKSLKEKVGEVVFGIDSLGRRVRLGDRAYVISRRGSDGSQKIGVIEARMLNGLPGDVSWLRKNGEESESEEWLWQRSDQAAEAKWGDDGSCGVDSLGMKLTKKDGQVRCQVEIVNGANVTLAKPDSEGYFLVDSVPGRRTLLAKEGEEDVLIREVRDGVVEELVAPVKRSESEIETEVANLAMNDEYPWFESDEVLVKSLIPIVVGDEKYRAYHQELIAKTGYLVNDPQVVTNYAISRKYAKLCSEIFPNYDIAKEEGWNLETMPPGARWGMVGNHLMVDLPRLESERRAKEVIQSLVGEKLEKMVLGRDSLGQEIKASDPGVFYFYKDATDGRLRVESASSPQRTEDLRLMEFVIAWRGENDDMPIDWLMGQAYTLGDFDLDEAEQMVPGLKLKRADHDKWGNLIVNDIPNRGSLICTLLPNSNLVRVRELDPEVVEKLKRPEIKSAEQLHEEEIMAVFGAEASWLTTSEMYFNHFNGAAGKKVVTDRVDRLKANYGVDLSKNPEMARIYASAKDYIYTVRDAYLWKCIDEPDWPDGVMGIEGMGEEKRRELVVEYMGQWEKNYEELSGSLLEMTIEAFGDDLPPYMRRPWVSVGKISRATKETLVDKAGFMGMAIGGRTEIVVGAGAALSPEVGAQLAMHEWSHLRKFGEFELGQGQHVEEVFVQMLVKKVLERRNAAKEAGGLWSYNVTSYDMKVVKAGEPGGGEVGGVTGLDQMFEAMLSDPSIGAEALRSFLYTWGTGELRGVSEDQWQTKGFADLWDGYAEQNGMPKFVEKLAGSTDEEYYKAQGRL